MIATSVFERNAEAWLSGARRALNEGGTSSSKTWSILQLLILIAAGSKSPLLISVVSESLPHLKRGCIRDFRDILGESWRDELYSKTEHTYPIGKCTIEFFGADDQGKVRGPRRDVLFVNEANNIPFDTARGLDIRTKRFSFWDWNPVSDFWAHQHWIGKAKNVYIHSTYLDAKHVLPAELVEAIEAYRPEGDTPDANWWNVYGLGRIGKVEGLVYPSFEVEDALPTGDVFYGLDFGYSTDPTALVKCVVRGKELHSQQLIYDKGLTNDVIASRMAEAGVRKGYDVIYADSAEPKSIEEIHRLGYNVKPCPKGPGSVEHGHQLVNQYKQFWTKDSVDGIKEQRNFRYITDKDGKITERTAHAFSHLMDARRYGVVGHVEPEAERHVVTFDSMQLVDIDF